MAHEININFIHLLLINQIYEGQILATWQKVDEETLKMLKTQKAFEDETAKRLTPFYNSIKSPFLKLFIHRIILDTMKHSDTYQTLIDLNEGALVGGESQEEMYKELTTHIEEESKMLEQAKEISNSIKDEKIKFILESIVKDEATHHEILKKLFEIIKKEAREWDRYFYELTSSGFP
jgi:rubrerythrin